MQPTDLFDSIQTAIQAEVDKDPGENFIYVEREMRGTFPTLIIRVLTKERKRKPKPGSVIITRQNGSEDGTEGEKA